MVPKTNLARQKEKSFTKCALILMILPLINHSRKPYFCINICETLINCNCAMHLSKHFLEVTLSGIEILYVMLTPISGVDINWKIGVK